MHTVIFDVGGTLIDSPDFFGHIMEQYYKKDSNIERYSYFIKVSNKDEVIYFE